MIWRIITTVVLFGIWSAVSLASNVSTTLASGKLSTLQFDNSDVSYALSTLGISAAHGVGTIIASLFILVLGVIWWGPVKRAIVASCVALLMFMASPTPTEAYWDKTDLTENYFILPNESAFLIPDVGANKDSQAKFGSREYLDEKRVPAKRVTIHHAKVAGSQWVGYDYYAPTERLIIVDRTPYSREWVMQQHRGSSNKDESFPCQSSEGLNVTAGIAIGASVAEEDVAKFLYRFGVKPPVGDRSKPEVIFTSVFYGQSLTEVMDSTIRRKVSSLVCNEFSKLTLDEGNKQAVAIMGRVEQSVTAYMNTVGITLEFIGYADTFTFDKEIQAVINDVYVTEKKAKIAELMSPWTGTLQALAVAKSIEGSHWDGKVPSQVSLWWLPDSVTNWFSKWFSSAPTVAPAPAAGK